MGDYAFSSQNNAIVLSAYIKSLENARIREAIHFEAERARIRYISEVKKLKAAGIKINTGHTKSKAVKKAQSEARSEFFDILGEVGEVKKASRTYKAPQSEETKILQGDPEKENSAHCQNKEITLLISISGCDDLAQLISCKEINIKVKHIDN